jgi:outer membrane protein TolC
MLGGMSTANLSPSIYSQDVYTLNVGVTETLLSWGLVPTFKLAKSNVKMAQLSYNRVRNDLVRDVKKAFYSVLFAKQTLEINSAAESVAKENFETTTALYNEGRVSSFDVSRAKVRWVSSEADLISAENLFNNTMEILKAVLSVPQDVEISILGSFSDKAVDFEQDDSVRQALQFRPEIVQSAEAVTAQKRALEISRADFFPALTGSFNYSWASPDGSLTPGDNYKTWTAQLALSIPIFDGMYTAGRYKAAKSGLDMADSNLDMVRNAVVMETRQADYSVKSALKSIQAQKENVDTAAENLRIARERYTLGLLSHLDLKDAELSLIVARTQYVKTLFDYNAALASMEHALGLPYR